MRVLVRTGISGALVLAVAAGGITIAETAHGSPASFRRAKSHGLPCECGNNEHAKGEEPEPSGLARLHPRLRWHIRGFDGRG